MNKKIILISALLALIIVLFSLPPAKQEYVQLSDSMAPTIKSGEEFSVKLRTLNSNMISRWDLIIFSPDLNQSETWCLRVMGLPNEKINVSENGEPLIGDSKLSFPVAYNQKDWKNSEYTIKTTTLGQDEFYLIGDNLVKAIDSRKLGTIKLSKIKGLVETLKKIE